MSAGSLSLTRFLLLRLRFKLSLALPLLGILVLGACAETAALPEPRVSSRMRQCDGIGTYTEVRRCEARLNQSRYRNPPVQTVFQEQRPLKPNSSSEPSILAPNLP